ncbi:MAG: Sulfhydrogenase 2 subunit gamma [Candidatus Bathyarchaeota archaeon BA2]|nr:MAG: Sulfhydrogenase 2 subunit gamma [Candidatus Bathyarchaeota archaeon BA2]
MQFHSQKRSRLAVYPTATNRLRIVKIQEVKKESPTVKTFIFHDRLCAEAEPGQFVMVWIPEVDEVPMSLSTISSGGLASISVADVGEATRAINERSRGDVLGVRGPYGNGFTVASGNVMVVGGGTGLVPLLPLAEKVVEVATKIIFLVGAKTKNELLFLDRIERMLSKVNAEIVATTEDGSYGLKGVVTDEAEKKLEKERFDVVYTCGPERMMYRMFVLAERYSMPLQASLERIMRCAIGLCGSCVIGGFRVCRDGPVFTSEQLRMVKEEFGKFKLDFQGKKTPIS